jgi:hypothetical protein
LDCDGTDNEDFAMLLSHFLTDAHKSVRNGSRILIVDVRDDFFASLASVAASVGLRIQRAASAGQATEQLSDGLPDLVIANCEQSDESGWLMASKWCLTRMPRRVWLYQAWPEAFDSHWIELTKVEQILYHEGDPLTLAEQVRNQLASERGRAA